MTPMTSVATPKPTELPPLLIIVGPTASGKTDLAIRLSQENSGEIVSADSVQVYRHFDIGSGKPNAGERAQARHHLIDICDPLDTLDAAQWAARAEASITDIRARGKLPIVCGGTFLWVRALVYGLAPAPPADENLRDRHRAVVKEKGRPALHAELAAVDRDSAERLNANDFVRVSRALEVYELTGKPMSEWQKDHGFRERRFDAKLVGLGHEREVLDARIRARVREMLDAGWKDEVRNLLARGFGDARAMGAVGYRQVRETIGPALTTETETKTETETETETHDTTDGELEDVIVRATRVFARRQRTWLRDEPVRWLTEPEAASITVDALMTAANAEAGPRPEPGATE
jgi:tRNA dimethylallyltransferase